MSDLNLYLYRAQVERWVDGDTVDVSIDCGLNVYTRCRLRLYGIDTWEVRGEEREKGLLAKARVEELAPVGSTVIIETYKDKAGKYGRWLATVWTVLETENGPALNQNVNKVLLDEGHGTEYLP